MRDRDGVEFVDDAVPPVPPSARTSLRVVLVLAIVAVLALATTLGRAHHRARPLPQPAAVATFALPDPITPSATLVAAFARYLPGAAVISERTSLQLDHALGTARFASREVRLALGGIGQVVLRIVPATSGAAAALQPPTLRLFHAGYAFDFTFTGIAPLSPQQLGGLVADARLVAVGA